MKVGLKKPAFRLIAIGLGIMAGLFIAECGVRYYWYGSKGFSYVKLNSFKTLGASGLLQRAEDDSILWELQPNLDTLFKFEPFSTNSVGMRDREYSLEKPTNTKRIVVIGDSFAMGSGVSDTENYPALLEQKFSAEKGDGKVEVLNFGVGSYGLRNYLAVLNQKAMAYEPDLIIIGFCGADDFLLPTKQSLEGLPPIKAHIEMFYSSHLFKLLKKPSSRYDREDNNLPLPTENQITHMDDHFLAILRNSMPKGIPVLIAYYSLIITPEVTDFMKKFIEDRDIHFVNASASLENVSLENQIIHPLDAHPNAMVHQVYASNIYKYLKTSTLLK